MENKNYYDILGLSEEDKALNGKEFEEKLKKSYKNLARKWHPDRFSTKSEKEQKEAEEKFKEIAEAYNVLSDPEQRRQYDFQTGGGPDFDPFAGLNPWDIFGGYGRTQQKPMYKGQNVDIEVVLTLEEAYSGVTKDVTYNRDVMCGHCNGTGSDDGKTHACPHCNGTGMVSERVQRGNMTMVSSHPCPHCNGTGKTYSKPCSHCNGNGMKQASSTERIVIPAGVVDGVFETFPGKGNELPKGYEGIPGDLHIIFRIRPHDVFKRESAFSNLRIDIDLNVFDAVLGCEKEVPCIDGSTVKIKIPELTENGHTFIIKGKGMPIYNNNKERGNMKVVVNVKMPKTLSNKQRELLKKVKNA